MSYSVLAVAPDGSQVPLAQSRSDLYASIASNGYGFQAVSSGSGLFKGASKETTSTLSKAFPGQVITQNGTDNQQATMRVRVLAPDTNSLTNGSVALQSLVASAVGVAVGPSASNIFDVLDFDITLTDSEPFTNDQNGNALIARDYDVAFTVRPYPRSGVLSTQTITRSYSTVSTQTLTTDSLSAWSNVSAYGIGAIAGNATNQNNGMQPIVGASTQSASIDGDGFDSLQVVSRRDSAGNAGCYVVEGMNSYSIMASTSAIGVGAVSNGPVAVVAYMTTAGVTLAGVVINPTLLNASGTEPRQLTLAGTPITINTTLVAHTTNFGQMAMVWDGTQFWAFWAGNAGGGQAQRFTVNTSTGNITLVGSLITFGPPGAVSVSAIPINVNGTQWQVVAACRTTTSGTIAWFTTSGSLPYAQTLTGTSGDTFIQVSTGVDQNGVQVVTAISAKESGAQNTNTITAIVCSNDGSSAGSQITVGTNFTTTTPPALAATYVFGIYHNAISMYRSRLQWGSSTVTNYNISNTASAPFCVSGYSTVNQRTIVAYDGGHFVNAANNGATVTGAFLATAHPNTIAVAYTNNPGQLQPPVVAGSYFYTSTALDFIANNMPSGTQGTNQLICLPNPMRLVGSNVTWYALEVSNPDGGYPFTFTFKSPTAPTAGQQFINLNGSFGNLSSFGADWSYLTMNGYSPISVSPTQLVYPVAAYSASGLVFLFTYNFRIIPSGSPPSESYLGVSASISSITYTASGAAANSISAATGSGGTAPTELALSFSLSSGFGNTLICYTRSGSAQGTSPALNSFYTSGGTLTTDAGTIYNRHYAPGTSKAAGVIYTIPVTALERGVYDLWLLMKASGLTASTLYTLSWEVDLIVKSATIQTATGSRSFTSSGTTATGPLSLAQLLLPFRDVQATLPADGSVVITIWGSSALLTWDEAFLTDPNAELSIISLPASISMVQFQAAQPGQPDSEWYAVVSDSTDSVPYSVSETATLIGNHQNGTAQTGDALYIATNAYSTSGVGTVVESWYPRELVAA